MEESNSILKNDLLGAHFLGFKTGFFSPKSSLFHFFPGFGHKNPISNILLTQHRVRKV